MKNQSIGKLIQLLRVSLQQIPIWVKSVWERREKEEVKERLPEIRFKP